MHMRLALIDRKQDLEVEDGTVDIGILGDRLVFPCDGFSEGISLRVAGGSEHGHTDVVDVRGNVAVVGLGRGHQLHGNRQFHGDFHETGFFGLTGLQVLKLRLAAGNQTKQEYRKNV